MPLTYEELKKRIHAARILRGLDQTDLDAMLYKDGLDKLEGGRIERGELPLTRVRRRALSDALRVPERWFQSEDVDEVVGYGDALPPAQQPDAVTLERIAATLDKLTEQLTEQEPEADDLTLERIAATLEKLEQRYAALEKRLGRVDPEVADEAIRVLRTLAEARSQGTGTPHQPDAPATDPPEEPQADAG